MVEAATCIELAAGEVHRRGVETAGTVAGVVDGAAWCQAFFDAHRPDAVRILDFGHASEHLTPVAEVVWDDGEMAQHWATAQRAELRAGPATAVLAAIGALPLAEAPDPAAAQDAQTALLGYFTPRLAQMADAAFRAQGLPIGSGAVESANKRVVAHRLKGAGRRWAEGNVNPMVALRGALCSERWTEAWTAIAAARPAQRRLSAPRRPRSAAACRRRPPWRPQRGAVARPPVRPSCGRARPQSSMAAPPRPIPGSASPPGPRPRSQIVEALPARARLSATKCQKSTRYTHSLRRVKNSRFQEQFYVRALKMVDDQAAERRG